MAKKDTNGQLNMFDFFGGDVQMVSLMPDDEFIDDAIGAGISGGFEEPDMEVVLPEDVPEKEVVVAKPEEPMPEPEEMVVKPVKDVPETVEKPLSKKKAKEKAPVAEVGYRLTIKDKNRPVMHRCFSLSGNTVDAVIAYLDYNRVYSKEPGQSPVCYQFADAKSAVNYYVDKMQQMGKDGVMKFVESEAVILPTETINMDK